MELKPVFEKIDFVNRYQEICEKYDDFDNGLTGNNKKLYTETLEKVTNLKAKYFSKDKIFEFENLFEHYKIILRFELHQGIVQALIFISVDEVFSGYCGRFDFLSEKISDNFNRRKYTLPNYTSAEELEEILKSLFDIYEDLKTALDEHLAK